jgi:predicted RNase H-like HicB family nuclease
MNIRGYGADVQRLSRELGGGFVAFAPALMGCVADGMTRREALKHLEDAIDCWLEIAAKQQRRIPEPGRG